MRSRTTIALPLAAAAVLALVGCSTSPGGGSATASPGGGGPIAVVASTNVYGGIVQAIGGAHVRVTSILSDPSQDPHSFEADARTQLAVSKADLVIENGGGYDTYIGTLMKSTHSRADLVDVVRLSGLDHGDPADFNEHVFYSYPTMVRFVAEIRTELTDLDRADASTFATRAGRLTTRLRHLESETAALRTRYHGEHVAYTEPVPGYLFDAIGLDNVTPTAFSHAIEEGDDVAPSALNDTLKLFSGSGAVRLLAVNDQTSSPETSEVAAAARKAGVPVIGVTETLPTGDDYVSWQQANIDAVTKALQR